MNASALRARAFFLKCRPRQWSCSASYKDHARPARPARRTFHSTSIRQQLPPEAEADHKRFRPFYVTTPIFYVNAEPHAGHLYTSILADVFKRWEVLKGDHQAALLTGTDEHGMKVQKAAEKVSLPPQELCDKNAQQFLQLAERANISFDRFIRTTDADHKTAVEHFWRELKKKNYIYESKHEGWYSISDETFYPESQVHLVLDPPTGRKIYASKETGKEVEWTSETNYHFRLSAFKERLLEHYEQHPNFIVPIQRMNFIKREVEAGLQDLSVSRPSSRLQWGIRVPDDDTQTIYVWLDALINYITATGYPSGDGDRHKLWPPNVQVIGKDIVRFHTIYWPAFLMALDLPLPRAFLTHAHWTLGSAKMSKSLGNGVNPFYAIERYGLDTIRYFMVHDGGIVDDANYDNSFIVDKYKKGLQGGMGNLLARILRGTKWTIRGSIEAVVKDDFGTPAPNLVKDMLTKIDATAKAADDAMLHLNPRLALHNIMELVYETNRFFSEAAPWELVGQQNCDNEDLLHRIIYTAAESARVSCILLQPFMPDKMREALDQLHVDHGKRSFSFATSGRDMSYGAGASERVHQSRPEKSRQRQKQAHIGVLFPPLISEF